MSEKINIVVGFDQRESVSYYTFTQSIIENHLCSFPLFHLQSIL